MMQQIFTTADSGESSEIEHNGGACEIAVDGTFNGCTVTAQAKLNGLSAWIPLDNGEWTAPLIKVLDIPRKAQIRLSISNEGGSTSINAWI